MEVLSLFDGISCGKVALDNLGIECNYYASEIDGNAVKVSQHRHPEITDLGDVRDVDAAGLDWDLLLGGSPCQSFSQAGHRTGFDGESNLFWEFMRVLESGNFKYFFLENVKMKNEWRDIITKELGVEPLYVDSRVFSAQSRKRYYWTNIPHSEVPTDDSPQVLADILEHEVDSKFYLSEKTIDRIKRSRTGGRFVDRSLKKTLTIIAGYGKLPSDVQYLQDEKGIRKFTPLEFERLQGLPDNYTECLSNTNRYHAVGNGWNIPTVEFFLKGLK